MLVLPEYEPPGAILAQAEDGAEIAPSARLGDVTETTSGGAAFAGSSALLASVGAIALRPRIRGRR